MAEGWIKLHRQIQDSEIWAGGNEPFDRRSAWIDLLMSANHEDKRVIFDYNPLIIKRGQYLTSVRELANRWKWGKDRVLKFLKLLERLGMVTKDSNNKRTLLTIVKYGDFQDAQDTDKDTGKDTGKDTEQTQNGRKSATNKNVKNERNINIYNIIPPTVEMVREYCQERNNGIDPEAFVSFYESKGWMIGKNKMKDWQSAVRTWERNRKSESAGAKTDEKTKKIHNFNERKYDYDDLIKELKD